MRGEFGDVISIHALLAESDIRYRVGIAEIDLAFLSTLSLRRATLVNMRNTLSPVFLSTLSLRRATLSTLRISFTACYFYPRSPCGERLLNTVQIIVVVVFLSTLSLRRATNSTIKQGLSYSNFYPRSPCGERLHETLHRGWFLPISIHALLAESDGNIGLAGTVPPTISIHALLAESDRRRRTVTKTL